MKIDAEKFWARFDELKDKSGRTILKLCELDPDLVYRTITQQRTRRITPSIEVIASFSRVFNVSIDFLVTGADPKPAPRIMTTFTESKTLMSIAHALAKADQRQIDAVQLILGVPPREESSKVLA